MSNEDQSGDKTIIDVYAPLKGNEMEADRREQIWDTLRQEMYGDSENRSARRRKQFQRWGWKKRLTAAAAAVFVLLGGSIYGVYEYRVSSALANAKTVLYQQPAQVVTGTWRVVIYHSILKPGPYYNVMLFYNGSNPLPKSWSVKTDWRGKTQSSIRTQVESTKKNDIVSEYLNIGPIAGFKGANQYKITWGPAKWHHTKKGNKFEILPGHKYEQTIDLARAKTNLHIANSHEYKGETAPWTISYASEDIVGQSFHYRPDSVLRIDFAGQHGLPKFHYAIPGEIEYSTMGSLSDTYRQMISPKSKAYQFGNTAKMTMFWQNRKAVVTLRKVK